ncbi:hybrid signal transduction histidine kinase G [Acrasis kona]|uniref:Hybrid signal transduction histidine kinase G n=1 Tax=Acrasis kona TaxID=1008807 RepID=A0AAW2ZJG0_9EUKA
MEEVLHRGQYSVVSRVYSKLLGRVVVKKKFNSEFPSQREKNKYAKEAKIGQMLQGQNCAMNYLKKEGSTKDDAIYMEDIGGWSMYQEVTQNGPFKDMKYFVETAIKIIQVVSRVHQNKIFHGSISPDHIIWNKLMVRLVDFSLSSELERDNIVFSNKRTVDVVSYLFFSPEQTGRMNREVDYRTDLYSLGLVFYFMLTGHIPFHEETGLDLIYSIIARQPTEPSIVSPTIPKTISDIVMKLLKKNVEDRYQGTFGLKSDLEQYLIGGRDFALATNDICSTFHPSQKLYGRDDELRTLLHSFDKVSSGSVRSMLVLVAGYSGVGKTALINEVHKPLVKEQGFFIQGKFDQFKRNNIPYFCFVSAFQQLVAAVLTESKESIENWKSKLLFALDDKGQLIIDVIPEIVLLIGPQPKVIEIGAEEAQSRFKNVFLSFVGVFAQPDHPLVIFLDDLQWADLATLSFLEQLLTTESIRSLLIFGAYRDNEVSESHALVSTVRNINKSGCSIDTILLSPLKLNHINQLVSDSMRYDPESPRLKMLSNLIQEKTDGNPFFLILYLKSLVQDGFIQFDFENGCWSFDINVIASKTQTTLNVVEMMTSRLRKMNSSTRTVMSFAACLGNRFEYKLLELVYSTIQGEKDCAEALWPVIKEGLIVQLGQDALQNKWLNRLDVEASTAADNHLQFLHDRVQQAAYELLDHGRRDLIHASIAKILLDTFTPSMIEDKIFDIVNHLQMGSAAMSERSECIRAAKIALTASDKAKYSNAAQLAIDCATFGLECLRKSVGEQDMWIHEYQLCLDLHKQICVCLSLTKQFSRGEEFYAGVEEKCSTTLDLIDVQTLHANFYEVQGKYKECVYLLRDCLALLGVDLHVEDPDLALKALHNEFRIINDHIQGKAIKDLHNDDRVMTRPEDIRKMQILNVLHAPCILIGILEVYSLVGALMVSLSLQHGVCEYTCIGYSYYGLCSAEHTKKYHEAFEFSKLGIKMSVNTPWHARCLLYHPIGIQCFFDDWDSVAQNIYTCMESAIRDSDLAMLIYSHGYYSFINSQSDHLNDVYLMVQSSLDFLNSPRHAFYYVVHYLSSYLRFMWTPESSVNLVNGLVSHHQPEQIPDPSWSLHNSIYNMSQLMLVFFRRDTHLWLEKLDRCRSTLYNITHLLFRPTADFYVAVVCLCIKYDDPVVRDERFEHADQLIERFQLWSQLNPACFKQQLTILLGLRCAAQGDTFEAIKYFEEAATGNFVMMQAVAYEFAAEVWFSIGGFKKEFRDSVYRSIYLYNVHGAVGKADQLRRFYQNHVEIPDMDGPIPRVLQSLGQHLKSNNSTSLNRNETPIDMMAIDMAGRALFDEATLDQSLNNMMRVVLQYAGATRGLYIQSNEGEDSMTVVAEGSVDNMQVDTMRIIPLAQYQDLPQGIIHYVMRTRDPVIIGSSLATSSSNINLQLLQEKSAHTRSVLCYPVLRNNNLYRGVLYLQSDTVDDAFSPNHLEIMSVLTSQLSSITENARLGQVIDNERRYRTATLELEQAKKRLEEFIDILCHELRNPLNVICSNNEFFIEMEQCSNIQPRELIVEHDEALKATTIAAEQLKDIIDNVLTASMLQNKCIQIQKTMLDPNELLDQVCDMFEEKIKEKNIKLVKEYYRDPNLPHDHCTVGDPVRLKEILVNLISNAIKFCDNKNGRINVRCETLHESEAETFVKFVVSDNGCGIAEKDISKILEPSLTNCFKLGLKISVELCKLMGGSISATSEPGRGSSFSASLKLHTLLSCESQSDTTSSTISSEDGEEINVCKTVLVVDDSPINQKILCRLLRKSGYLYDVADDGLQAVQMIAVQKFDVVLMDIEMPGMNGIEATKRVRQMEQERGIRRLLPIIGVSGNSQSSIIDSISRAGMQSYVTKPYMSSEIIQAIETFTKKKK